MGGSGMACCHGGCFDLSSINTVLRSRSKFGVAIQMKDSIVCSSAPACGQPPNGNRISRVGRYPRSSLT